MRKQELVEQLNTLLGMEHPLSVWQCLQIRKYELEELVDKVHDLYRAAGQCGEIREQCPLYDLSHRTPYRGGRQSQDYRV